MLVIKEVPKTSFTTVKDQLYVCMNSVMVNVKYLDHLDSLYIRLERKYRVPVIKILVIEMTRYYINKGPLYASV